MKVVTISKKYLWLILSIILMLLIFLCRLTVFGAVEIVDEVLPTTPINLTAVAGRYNNFIRLNWEPSQDNIRVAGYKIFRDNIEIATTRKIIFFDRDVEKLIDYEYKIVAYDDNQNISEFSNIVQCRIEDNIPPEVPSNLNTTEITSNSIELTWDVSLDNVETSGYYIFRNGVQIDTVDTNSYQDINLLPYRTYCYNIKAFDKFNNVSRKSKTFRVKTLKDTQNSDETNEEDEPQQGSGDDDNTSQISQFEISFVKNDSNIELSWNAIVGIDKFNVYRKIGVNSGFEKVAQVIETKYLDSNLEDQNTYFYKIGYVDLEQNEQFSNDYEVNYVVQTIIEKNITEDMTWDSLHSPYIVKNNITIEENVLLKILPGTIIRFHPDVKMIIKGDVEAIGDADNKIEFKSFKDNPLRLSNLNEYWDGIYIDETGEFDCQNALIQYGGNSSLFESKLYYTNILNKGTLSLVNCEIKNSSGGSGLYIETNNTTVVDGCLFDYNAVYGIFIYNCSDILIKNNTFTQNGTVGDICLNYNGSMNIEISNNTFISSTIGINIINFEQGPLKIHDNIINGAYPINIALTGLQCELNEIFSCMTNNTLNGYFGQIGLSGSVMNDCIIPNDKFSSYTVSSSILISQGKQLSIEKGVTLKFGQNKSLFVYGKLSAIGTNEHPILFTSMYEQPEKTRNIDEYWNGIQIKSTGEFIGENIKIEYGGYLKTSILYVEGKLNLTNSTVCNTHSYGITLNTNIQPNVKFNNFYDNYYGIYNKLYDVELDLSYNYWGSIYGPSVFDSSTYSWKGDGDRASNSIIYEPWIGQNEIIETHFGDEGTNFATGNFSITFTDMSMNVPGFELNISRTYNSRANNVGTLGKGWTFGLEGSIKEHDSKFIIVRLPNGGVQTFEQNSSGTYSANDSRSELFKQDGKFILKTKDMYTYGYNENGHLIWMKDRNSNTISIEVDENRKVQKVIDQIGREFNIQYNIQGFIQSVIDPIGRRISYEYENGLLSKVTDEMGYSKKYIYNSEGLLSEIRDNDLKLLKSIEYDYFDNESCYKVCKMTDEYKNEYTYQYNNVERKTIITDLNRRTTIKWFDSSMYPIKVQDAQGKITTTEFCVTSGINRYGEPRLITDRNGNKSEYIRDYKGNMTKSINADDSFKEYKYDQKNNLIFERDECLKNTHYIYDEDGINLLKMAKPLNGTENYYVGCDESNFAVTEYIYYAKSEYNIGGLLKYEINPQGNTTTYTYDQYGNIKTITDSENNTTTFEYNQIGWKTKEISPSGNVTTYVYDNNGNLIKTILNNGETTRAIYENNRKIKEVSANLYDDTLDNGESYNGNHGFRYTYYSNEKVKSITDAQNNMTTYMYDLYGNVITETKPDGCVYEYEYDEINRLISLSFKDNLDAEPILLEEFNYTILVDGKTQKVHKQYYNQENFVQTVYIYDYETRLVQKTNPDGTSISNEYYTNGSTKSEVDEKCFMTHYKYDGLNRLCEKWVPLEEINGQVYYKYYSYEYDKTDNLIAEKTGIDKVLAFENSTQLITKYFEYFKNGKLKCEYYEQRKTEYTYDADGNVAKVVVHRNETEKNVVEYQNNHFGKPVQEVKYVLSKDIYSNDIEDESTIFLKTTYTYDKNGNVKTMISPKGITTIYEYDNLNRVTAVSRQGQDEYGPLTLIVESKEYNWQDKVLSQWDANGNITRYEYDKMGNLVRKVDAKGGITAFYYDHLGRKIVEVLPNDFDANKNLNELNRTKFTYDSMNRILAITNIYLKNDEWMSVVSKTLTYDLKGNITKEVDAFGNGKEYTYNLQNQVLSILDGEDNLTQFEYDGIGRKINEINSKGVVKRFYYDSAGNIVKTTLIQDESSDEVTLNQVNYDLGGNKISEIDANGNITKYEYNSLNKIRKIIYPGDETIPSNTEIYQYDVAGNLKMKKDSFGTIDIYEYDNFGCQVSHTVQNINDNNKIVTLKKYDKNGNIRFEIDGNGNTKENVYDELNRKISSQMFVNGTYHNTIYIYDKNSNLISETDWLGNTISFKYDSLNRLIEKINAKNVVINKAEYYDNGLKHRENDALGNITTYLYDKNNRLIKTIYPEGNEKTIEYDEVGNIICEIDGNGNTTNFEYDMFGNLTKVINAKGEVTSYAYDLNNNMLSIIDGNRNVINMEYSVRNNLSKRITDEGIESYTYFPNTLVETTTDRNGTTIEYFYDVHGRLVEKRTNDNVITFKYDGNDNIIEMSDSTGITKYNYDEINRITQKYVPNIDKIVYYYDIIDNIPQGYSIQKIIDPKSNIVEKVYDKNGRPYKTISEGKETVYQYYDNGLVLKVNYPDNGSVEYEYNANGMLTALTNKNSSGAIIDQYIYTYDNNNNKISETDSSGTINYEYDELNRLTKVTNADGKITDYTFGGAGNRTSKKVTYNDQIKLTTYGYQNNKLIIESTKLNDTLIQKIQYEYDSNGNNTKITKIEYADGVSDLTLVTTNIYDEFNQLIETITPGNTAQNIYNGNNKRVAKKVNGQITYFVLDNDNVILELNDSLEEKAHNIYGLNLVSRNINDNQYYYFYNGHSDVVEIRDENESTVAKYKYDEYGNITEILEYIDNPFRYAGYYYDDETYNYYLISRMYNPSIGRFIQQDSYKGNIKNPQSLNLYTYCYGNPVMYYDPDGHFWKEIGEWGKQKAVKTKNKIKGVIITTRKATNDIKEKSKERYVLVKNWSNKKIQTTKSRIIDTKQKIESEYVRAKEKVNNGLNYATNKTVQTYINTEAKVINEYTFARSKAIAGHQYANAHKEEINLAVKIVANPATGLHYDLRDYLNKDAPTTEKEAIGSGYICMKEADSVFHQIGEEGRYNKKYISQDGHYEGVYNHKGVSDDSAINKATYNYYSAVENPLGHIVADVVPYYVMGNTKKDALDIYAIKNRFSATFRSLKLRRNKM